MAADQILALEVVTANGTFVTATPVENNDLYWALSGGGGSTYGIVTSVIVKARPQIHVTKSLFSFQTSPTVSVEAFWAALHSFFENFIPFTDAGTYSYWSLERRDGKYSFDMTPFFAPNHTIESFNALVKPWFDRIAQLGIKITPKTTFHPDFYDAYQNEAFGNDERGGFGLVRQGSRLFPRANWEDKAKLNATFDVVRKTIEKNGFMVGYHQAPRNRGQADNAVNPAWRQTIAFLITASLVPENPTIAQIRNASDTLTRDIMGQWRAVAPNSAGGGVYGNEADLQEPDWQREFYGSLYPRLYQIKQKWDPTGVFYAHTAVGSEHWVVRDGDQGVQTQNGRLCRVESALARRHAI